MKQAQSSHTRVMTSLHANRRTGAEKLRITRTQSISGGRCDVGYAIVMQCLRADRCTLQHHTLSPLCYTRPSTCWVCLRCCIVELFCQGYVLW